jgi:hypothetical protein
MTALAAIQYNRHNTLNKFDARFLPKEIGKAVEAFEKANAGIREAQLVAKAAKEAFEKASNTGADIGAWEAAKAEVPRAEHGVKIAIAATHTAWDAMQDVIAEHQAITLATFKEAHTAEHEKLCTALHTLEGVIEKMSGRVQTHNFVIAPAGKLAAAVGGPGTTEAERMELLTLALRMPPGYDDLSKAINGVLNPPPPPGQKLGQDGQTGTAKENREENASKDAAINAASVKSEARGNLAARLGITLAELDAQEAKGSRVLEGDDALKAIEDAKAKAMAEGMTEPDAQEET